MSRATTQVAVMLALTLGAPAPSVSAQASIGVSTEFLGYNFDSGLGASAAQLLLVPVAVRLPISVLTFDVYGAWAEGRVEREGSTRPLVLNGPVDTRVQASVQATPWVLLTIGANLPTGSPTHSAEEAIVSSVLATDLLGFREATWGSGTSITSSLATAVRAGGFGLGIAGAYALRGEFAPSADVDSLRYQPGSETRLRVGLDRNFGNSTFTAGGTFITYTQDQANGVNLFQAGNRLRFDASFAFRASGGIWTIYAADLTRSKGDLSLQVVDELGVPVDSTVTVTTAKQNLLIAGLVGTVGIGGGFVFRPSVDVKYQTLTDADGGNPGSGWIVAAGTDIPMRIFGTEFFPKGRVLFGSIESQTGATVNLLGMELKGTLRWSF